MSKLPTLKLQGSAIDLDALLADLSLPTDQPDDKELLLIAMEHSIEVYHKRAKAQPYNEAFYRSRIRRLNTIQDRLTGKVSE